MGRRVRAYVGLGSNVGDSRAILARAVGALAALPHLRLRAVSPIYRTAPVGVLDQPDFLNAVVALDVAVEPDHETAALAFLRQLKALEAELGRRPGRRWGPRVIDLDLLLFGRARVLVERPPEPAAPAPGEPGGLPATGEPGGFPAPKLLQVPHGDVADRLFVLAPLADLVPGLVPPGWTETVASARARRAQLDGAGAARLVGEWDPARGRWEAPATARPVTESRARARRLPAQRP